MSATRSRKLARTILGGSLLIVIGAGFSVVGNASEKGVPSTPASMGYVRVVVAPGETLWSLASMVAGSGSVTAVEQEIVDANQLSSTDIAAGDRLWVPSK